MEKDPTTPLRRGGYGRRASTFPHTLKSRSARHPSASGLSFLILSRHLAAAGLAPELRLIAFPPPPHPALVDGAASAAQRPEPPGRFQKAPRRAPHKFPPAKCVAGWPCAHVRCRRRAERVTSRRGVRGGCSSCSGGRWERLGAVGSRRSHVGHGDAGV